MQVKQLHDAIHAAAAPHFGDIRAQVQVVLIMLRIAKQRCFGIDLISAFTNIGVP